MIMPLALLGDRDTRAFNLPASRGKDEFQESLPVGERAEKRMLERV